MSTRRSGGRPALGPHSGAPERLLSEERARTQAWLHDHTLQLLEFIAAGAYDEAVGVARLRDVAALAADELREYLEGTGVSPAADLATALRREIAEVQLTAGALTIELDCRAIIAGLSADQVASLAATVREVLTNVCKHASAMRVVVSCAATQSGVEVTVADDGVGFDPGRNHSGAGLRLSVVGRMLACGGSARVVSDSSHGTTVILTVGSLRPRPLPRAPHSLDADPSSASASAAAA